MWILGGVFSLPIIPIIFATLRLVMAKDSTHNVDPIRFQLYSMLENTSAIITSCLPSIRLFVVNIRASTHLGSSRYWHGVASSLKVNDQKTLHRPRQATR